VKKPTRRDSSQLAEKQTKLTARSRRDAALREDAARLDRDEPEWFIRYSPYWGVLRALPEWRGAPRGLALAAADAESLVAAMRAAEREAIRATTRPALAVTR